MPKCRIATPDYVDGLLVRYNGIGRELTHDEREILLFSLYNESEMRGGIAAQAKAECDRIWRNQQIVKRGDA